jgi:hypothetical protein
MSKPTVIVCEKSGDWAAALARHLPNEIEVRQTRGLGECATVLATAPASLLALKLTCENLPGVLVLLGNLGRKHPQAVAVVLAERGLEPCEWLLREAGAVHFTTSPREGDEVARLAVRHFSRAKGPRANFAARIWNELPWSDPTRS